MHHVKPGFTNLVRVSFAAHLKRVHVKFISSVCCGQCCVCLPQTSLMSPVEMYDSTHIEVLKSTAAAAILGMLEGEWHVVIHMFLPNSNTWARCLLSMGVLLYTSQCSVLTCVPYVCCDYSQTMSAYFLVEKMACSCWKLLTMESTASVTRKWCRLKLPRRRTQSFTLEVGHACT